MGVAISACSNSNSLVDDNNRVDAIIPQQAAAENYHKQSVSARGNAALEREMQAILADNPQQAAEKAMQQGDRRFWAYYQRSELIVPGIEGQSSAEDGAFKIVPGLGDVVYGKAHKELRQTLKNYIQEYNQQLNMLIETN